MWPNNRHIDEDKDTSRNEDLSSYGVQESIHLQTLHACISMSAWPHCGDGSNSVQLLGAWETIFKLEH